MCKRKYKAKREKKWDADENDERNKKKYPSSTRMYSIWQYAKANTNQSNAFKPI